jgi:uncharacterized protein
MRDFGAAIGLVLALEGLLTAGLVGSMPPRMAVVARQDPAKLRGVGLGAGGM